MEISNSSDNTEVGQLTSAPDGQAQTTGEVKDELIPKKDYLELQSQSTKWRQNQIDVAIKLVGKDKSEINTLTDDKLKDIVAKQLFGYSTYDEMVAIEGNDFSTPTDIGDDEDKVRKLEKQVKILSYQQQVKELDNAIAKYKAANPSYFTSTDGEVELKESLKLISWGADMDERVRLAWKLAFSWKMDNRTAAYLAMANGGVGEGSTTSDEGKTKTNEKSDDIIKFLFKKK